MLVSLLLAMDKIHWQMHERVVHETTRSVHPVDELLEGGYAIKHLLAAPLFLGVMKILLMNCPGVHTCQPRAVKSQDESTDSPGF